MERNGWVEFGFDFCWICFVFPTLSLYHGGRACLCRWFYKGFYYKQTVASGLAGVWRIQDSQGCLFRFPRRQFHRDRLVWQSILDSELARCVCMLWDGVCSQALPCRANRKTDVYAKI
jgi:hypothetical protein